MKIRTTGVSDKEMELVMDSMVMVRHRYFDNGSIQVAKLVDTNVQRSRFGRLYLNARFEINGITFRKSFTLPSEVDSFNDCQEFERFLFAIGATGEEDALYRLIGKTCKVRIGVTEHDREFIAEFVIEDDIFHLHPQR